MSPGSPSDAEPAGRTAPEEDVWADAELPGRSFVPTPSPDGQEAEQRPGSTHHAAAGGRVFRSVGTFFRELPGLLLLAFVLALIIKTFLVQAFYIPSGSMEHTLDIGDRVLVNKVVYHLHSPRRGDIIVFSDPHPATQPDRGVVSAFFHWLTDGLGLSRDPNKDFIKRVIGLPGETVEINRGVVYVDGRALDEHYLGPVASTGNYGPERVQADHLFVMGDNRGDSNDSRGTLREIPMDKVIGRAFVIMWPPSRIGLLRRPHYANVSNSATPADAAAGLGLAVSGLVVMRRRRSPPRPAGRRTA